MKFFRSFYSEKSDNYLINVFRGFLRFKVLGNFKGFLEKNQMLLPFR